MPIIAHTLVKDGKDKVCVYFMIFVKIDLAMFSLFTSDYPIGVQLMFLINELRMLVNYCNTE
jgi:hypothetical protein